MSDHNYQPPKLRNIVFGVVLFTVLICSLYNLPSTMKQVGNIFLYLPSQLGLIQLVVPDEIHTIDLRTPSPTVLDITRPGQYAVYTGDYDALLANVLERSAWLQVRSHTTGERVKVVPVARGARPYDTCLAAGRPIFVFEVTVPGRYEIAYYFRYASISIVPDYTTGKELVIVFAYLVQIVILLTLVVIVYYLHYRRHQKPAKSIEVTQKQRRTKDQAFWETLITSREKETQKKQ